MNCKSCGAGLRPDDKFCSSCGTRVEADASAAGEGDGIAASEAREPEMPVQGTGVEAGERTPERPSAGTGETGEKTAEATGEKTGEKAAEESISTMPVTPPVKIADISAASAADGGKTAVAVADKDVHTQESPEENGKQKKEKKEKNAKTSSGRNAGRILLSILLSLLLFVSLLASSLVTMVRLTVREENLESALRDLSLSSLKVGSGYEMDPDDQGDTASDGTLPADTEELADYLYDMAKDAPGWENATRKDIAKAMEEPLVNEFLTQMATDYADVIIRGEDPAGKGLTPENITDFVLDHEEETLDVMQKAGYTGDLRIDREELESALRDSIGDTYVPENIVTGDYQEYLTIFRIVVSLPVLIGLWVITAALVILLIVVNKHRFSAVLSCVGVPALIIGLLFMAAWCAINLYPPMREGLLSLIPLLLGSDLLIFGAGLAGGGLLFVIIKAIVRSIQKKRRA